MAGSLTFYLNGKYIYASYYAADRRVQMGINLRVDPEKFKDGKLSAGKLTKEQKAVLSRLEALINNYESSTRLGGVETSAERIEDLILEGIGKPRKVKITTADSFYEIYHRYLEEVKAGRILNDGKNYSDSFIKSAGVVERKWLKGRRIGTVQVERLDVEIMREFVADLTESGLAKNSVASYMDPVISIYNGSRRLGWHKGPLLDTRAFRARREDIDHGQYLTKEDQKKILALELEGNKAVWRDAFILGCRLGMRHSDLSRLTMMHRQGELININTQKTGTPVWVPLDRTATRLWEQYDGNVTVPGLTEFMLFAKELGAAAAQREEELGETKSLGKDVLFSRTEGGKKVERWMKKYELLGTHTMRRSFATNAYKALVPVPSIMKVTGHKSHASFLKYVRLSDEEHGRLLGDHDYFKLDD